MTHLLTNYISFGQFMFEFYPLNGSASSVRKIERIELRLIIKSPNA